MIHLVLQWLARVTKLDGSGIKYIADADLEWMLGIPGIPLYFWLITALPWSLGLDEDQHKAKKSAPLKRVDVDILDEKKWSDADMV